MLGLTWLKRIITIALLLFLTSLVVLTIVTLTKPSYRRSGLLTVTFNSASFLDDVFDESVVEDRDLFQSLGAKFTGAVDHVETVIPALETAIPDVVDRVSSAANAIATKLPGAIEDTLLPRNFSIGTSQFCIGFANDVSCHELPPDISTIIPDEIRGKFGDLDQIGLFSSFTNIKKMVFQNFWVIGIILVSFAVGMSTLTIIGRFIPGFRILRMAVFFTTSTICLSLYLVPVVILHFVKKKADSIPAWLEVSHGDVPVLFTTGLCCVVGVVLLGGIAQFIA